MYFKINDKVLFRQYLQYGYITDNSMFGYRFLDDDDNVLDEKYVSEVGAVILGVLTKTPQDLNDIIKKLLTIFIDIEYEELKHDVFEFLMQFVDGGYLNCGETYESCNYSEIQNIEVFCNNRSSDDDVQEEDCSKNLFHPDDFLRSIHIEIANKCNESCVHCYIPHEYKNTVMNSNLFYKIVEEGRAMNVINVTISGGEPLLHKDILSFLKKCRDLDLSVNVLTNLTLLTDDIVSEMKKNPLLSVQTSIYSMNPSIHDLITQVPGSLKKTKEAVLKLIYMGIPVQISCPIMKQNKDVFQDVIAWGNRHNILVLVDYVIFASYDHSNSNLVNRLSLEEVEDVFENQISEEYVYSLSKAAKEKCLLTGEDSICSVCRYYLCVSAAGDVFPCVGWQSNKIGNLIASSLEEIWKTSPEIKYLRQIKCDSFPKCVSCKDKGYCTICMMSNSNENKDGNYFKINDYHCKVASMIHLKIDAYLNKNKD